MNVRMTKETGRLWWSVNSGNTLENYLAEDRAEPESKREGGAEPNHTANVHNVWNEVFFF